MMNILVWLLGASISIIAMFTLFVPQWQLRLMRWFRLKPAETKNVFIQRFGLLKLAIGIAIMAIAMVF